MCKGIRKTKESGLKTIRDKIEWGHNMLRGNQTGMFIPVRVPKIYSEQVEGWK